MKDRGLFIFGLLLAIILLLSLASCSNKDTANKAADSNKQSTASPVGNKEKIDNGGSNWCNKELFQRLDLEGYDHNSAVVTGPKNLKIFDTSIDFCRASNLEGGNLGKIEQWYSEDDKSEIRAVYDESTDITTYEVKWINLKGEECHIRKNDLNFDLGNIDLSTIGWWYCGDRIIAGPCTGLDKIGQTCQLEDY